MKNLEIDNIIKEIIEIDERYSDTINELPSYKSLMNDLFNNYSNDELETLQHLFEELGRNIEHDILQKNAIQEYSVSIENTKNDRKNNIRFRVYCRKILKLSNKDKLLDVDNVSQESTSISFYKNKYETIEPIYQYLDEICSKFGIIDKEEAEKDIEAYTGMKRKLT